MRTLLAALVVSAMIVGATAAEAQERIRLFAAGSLPSEALTAENLRIVGGVDVAIASVVAPDGGQASVCVASGAGMRNRAGRA